MQPTTDPRLPLGLRRGSTSVLLSLALLGGSLLAAAGLQAQPGFSRTDKAMVEAFLDRTSYAPGETARLAVRVLIEDGWHLQAHEPTYDYLIATVLEVSAAGGTEVVEGDEVDPEADGSSLILGSIDYPEPLQWRAPFAGDEILDVYEGEVFVLAPIQIPAGAEARTVELRAVLSYQACDDRVCLAPTQATTQAVLTIGDPGEPQHGAVFERAAGGAPAAAEAAGEPEASPDDLAWMLGLAFVGGLILNLMPCVLPVLSIKVFGLLRAAESGHGSVRRGALAFSAGILTSFWLLGLAAVALRATGEAIGWGIQFQNPVFVAFLTLVMVFFSLNLWGLFEIPLPGFLGANAAEGGSLGGHFGTGLLATLMATPCSAPFLGTAVGFALARPPMIILAIFTAVGLGLAAPNLLLAISPRAARLLPRPGAWMETLKGVFGFFLAATAIWLLYVLNSQIASDALAFLQGSLLAVGLFVWLRFRWHGREGARRHLATAGVILAALSTLWIASQAPAVARDEVAAGAYDWQVFGEAEAQRLAAAGELVFVDVTADWCATCKVNERVVLANEEVRRAFRERGVVMMKADWTNRDPTIARYLAKFGRYAIPFYVLYRPGEEPHVFGELLSKRSVLRVLAETTRPRIAAPLSQGTGTTSS